MHPLVQMEVLKTQSAATNVSSILVPSNKYLLNKYMHK